MVCIVSDPGCLTRNPTFIHPGSRIQQQQKKMRVKTIGCSTFFVDTNIANLRIILLLDNSFKNFSIFNQTIVTKLLKIWVWDPGSGIYHSGYRVRNTGGTGP